MRYILLLAALAIGACSAHDFKRPALEVVHQCAPPANVEIQGEVRGEETSTSKKVNKSVSASCEDKDSRSVATGQYAKSTTLRSDRESWNSRRKDEAPGYESDTREDFSRSTGRGNSTTYKYKNKEVVETPFGTFVTENVFKHSGVSNPRATVRLRSRPQILNETLGLGGRRR